MTCEPPAIPRATPDVATLDILLVEDEPRFRELLWALLTQAGYRVVAVSNGRAALTFLTVRSARLLITDICMPETDGFELLTKLRRTQPMLPIIAMSGGVDISLQYLKTASFLGAVRTLPKPFPLTELTAAEEATIGHPRGAGFP